MQICTDTWDYQFECFSTTYCGVKKNWKHSYLFLEYEIEKSNYFVHILGKMYYEYTYPKYI